MTRQRSVRGAAAILALALLAACAPTPGGDPSDPNRTVDEAEAIELARSAFDALNDGDYAKYSAHWSNEMKAAIEEETFLAFRQDVLATVGPFVSIKEVTTTSVEPGTYRYVFTVAFERGEAQLAFGFKEGSDLIQGVFVL